MELFRAITDTHPFLRNLSRQQLDTVLKGAVISEFEPREIVLREGDYADKIFLVHEGAIHIECHAPERDVIVETLRSGDVLGWSWLFPPFSSHFQARAAERTITLQLDGAHLLIECENDDRLGNLMMKRIAQILIHRLQSTRKRLIDECERSGVEVGETA